MYMFCSLPFSLTLFSLCLSSDSLGFSARSSPTHVPVGLTLVMELVSYSQPTSSTWIEVCVPHVWSIFWWRMGNLWILKIRIKAFVLTTESGSQRISRQVTSRYHYWRYRARVRWMTIGCHNVWIYSCHDIWIFSGARVEGKGGGKATPRKKWRRNLHHPCIFSGSERLWGVCQNTTKVPREGYQRFLPELYVGPSKLHGFGLFCKNALFTGTWLTEYSGEYLSHDDAKVRMAAGTDTHIRTVITNFIVIDGSFHGQFDMK